MKIPFELAISLGVEEYTDINGIINYSSKFEFSFGLISSMRIAKPQKKIEIKVENLHGTDAGQEMLFRAAIDRQPAWFKEIFSYGSMFRDNKFQGMVIYEGSEATELPTSCFTIISS